MQRILSTYLFVSHKLTPALLGEIAAAHIPAVEIFCERAHFDYSSPQVLREIADWLDEHELMVHSLHSPTSRDIAPTRESRAPISISDLERVRRLDAVDEVKRALDVAERIPFRYLVQHLGASRESADPRRLDAAFSSLEYLVVFAKQRGVRIALENTPGELASPGALRQFIADTRLDLRLCFDTGHAHMEDGVEHSFDMMRDLVVTTHVHDNHGEKDDHLLPFAGSIDWKAAMKGFAEVSPGGARLPVVLELKEAALGPKPLEQVAATFEKLERSAEPGEMG
jgi:sugar phosphate isomerase/epimerase